MLIWSVKLFFQNRLDQLSQYFSIKCVHSTHCIIYRIKIHLLVITYLISSKIVKLGTWQTKNNNKEHYKVRFNLPSNSLILFAI